MNIPSVQSESVAAADPHAPGTAAGRTDDGHHPQNHQNTVADPHQAATSQSDAHCVVRSYTASDGCTLHFRHWPAVGPAQGTVVALHGIQSHSGWYKWSSAQMANAGFNVYFADRRGSGLNGFRRGHADHGTRLLNDVRQLTRLARHENASTADLPLTLLGLSWGGRIAAAFAATYPRLIDRLVLLYPGITPRIRPTRWQNFQLQMARRHDVREKSIPIPLDDPSLFTSSKDWQNFILNDPLTLHRVTTGFLNSGRDLDHIIQTNSHHITHPALVMLAGNDQIIDNDATRQCVAAFQSPHVTTITYPNACHTLEFEPDRQRFADDLVKWLQDSQ